MRARLTVVCASILLAWRYSRPITLHRLWHRITRVCNACMLLRHASLLATSPWRRSTLRTATTIMATSSAPVAAVTIRRASLGDAERLLELVNGAYRGAGNWTNEQGLVAGPRVTLPQLRQLLRKADEAGAGAQEFVLCAWADEALVGCVEVSTTDAAAAVAQPGDGPRDGYLGMLSVDATVGSRGVGRQLMSAGEEACRDVFGCRCVVLFVLSLREDVKAWYARRGYENTGLSVGPAVAKEMVESLHADAKILAEDADFLIIRKRVI